MKRLIIIFLIISLALVSCNSSTKTNSAQDYFDKYSGNLSVYQEILSMTNCALLQEQFNLAAANNDIATPGTAAFKWSTGYMAAADDRMKEQGCY